MAEKEEYAMSVALFPQLREWLSQGPSHDAFFSVLKLCHGLKRKEEGVSSPA
jgi:hypothetical protein